ncbi:hypothetical protein [Nitrosomonas sp.]|uniref:hypothetical protein n=1 Tax=Nitrosomonas sp. TaxID=42353 RepID=UPI002730AE68|nr:hypothetical protein [Nitrosomonas sp.]MDP1786424.1 hypothetical protein [Nitrosomonas sp.]
MSRFESHLTKTFIKQLATTGFMAEANSFFVVGNSGTEKTIWKFFGSYRWQAHQGKSGVCGQRLSQQRQSAVSKKAHNQACNHARAYKNKPLSASQSWRIN